MKPGDKVIQKKDQRDYLASYGLGPISGTFREEFAGRGIIDFDDGSGRYEADMKHLREDWEVKAC